MGAPTHLFELAYVVAKGNGAFGSPHGWAILASNLLKQYNTPFTGYTKFVTSDE